MQKNRQVTTDEGYNFAQEQNFFFMEISALENNDNCIEAAFNILVTGNFLFLQVIKPNFCSIQ